MGEIARRSIKGYTYQQSVFILFLSLMDTERKISKITIEALNTKNFDDIYLEEVHEKGKETINYRIQAKNYPNTSVEDIAVINNKMIIKGNSNEFDSEDNNILVVNTSLIETDKRFMGLPCTMIDEIIIIPLTPEQIIEKMDSIFNNESRELQIIHEADKVTENAKFVITQMELPPIIQMSIDLENDTVLLRKIPDEFNNETIFIEGKPGVGKSHFVNEIIDKFPNAIVYRFWVGSQDPNRNKRLLFENFISEMGIKVYKTAKKVIINELIETIKIRDEIVIIDGLDHVENYNPQELRKFIEFIDKLEGAKVIVLSRPLKTEIPWNKETLLDWNYDDTRLYLEIAHEITDYKIQNQIFQITGGYPMITYFVAEDYNINHVVNIDKPITEINEYYDSLFINNDKPSSAIGVFAVGNCYFTKKELKEFFMDPEMYDVICEFINLHPYLFKILVNRISLIHDSFNTYIRMKISTFERRKEKVIEIIRKSILSGSIEYMERMESFNFDDDFYKTILLKYCDFNEFVNLIMSTNDYNSIQSFYNQLQVILENQRGLFDTYQYYSFVLLYQIANRNNLIGHDSLILQMLIYMNEHGGIADNIFSSNYIWQVYLACKNHEKLVAQYIQNQHISDSQFYDLIRNINADCSFYEKKEKVVSYEQFIKELNNEESFLRYKDSILADYLISVWIHGNSQEQFHDSFVKYLDGEKNSISELLPELEKYGFDRFWIESGLSKAEYQLHELGYFGDKNKFRGISLMNIIKGGAKEGSYSVVNLAASYIKLANYEKREVDINSLALAWTMYFNHKDYSTFTIDKALIVFEKKDIIKEEESFELIEKHMEQSDKGISHLLTSYSNKKGPRFIEKINNAGYFKRYDCGIRFWELETENYECFSKGEISRQVSELLGTYYHGKTIEGKYLQAIAKSRYGDMVLDGIEYYDYSVLSPDDSLVPVLEERNIKYFSQSEQKAYKHTLFEDGYIREEDFDYIIQTNMSCTDVSSYADGWYSCMPFVAVYKLFDIKDIQKNYMEILHNSIFARTSEDRYIGNWNLLLGNMLEFLLEYDIDVDWNKLFLTFKSFLDISLIEYSF